MAFEPESLKAESLQAETLAATALEAVRSSGSVGQGDTASPAVDEIEVVGVSMERGCAMYESQRAGQPVEVEELETLADSLGGGIGLDNRFTFQMVRDLVDRLELVDEDLIAEAIGHLHRFEGQTVEGAAAVGVALLLAESRTGGGAAVDGATVVVVSGGNIDPAVHSRLVAQAHEGRPAR